jgi:hypothetical protein
MSTRITLLQAVRLRPEIERNKEKVPRHSQDIAYQYYQL